MYGRSKKRRSLCVVCSVRNNNHLDCWGCSALFRWVGFLAVASQESVLCTLGLTRLWQWTRWSRPLYFRCISGGAPLTSIVGLQLAYREVHAQHHSTSFLVIDHGGWAKRPDPSGCLRLSSWHFRWVLRYAYGPERGRFVVSRHIGRGSHPVLAPGHRHATASSRRHVHSVGRKDHWHREGDPSI